MMVRAFPQPWAMLGIVLAVMTVSAAPVHGAEPAPPKTAREWILQQHDFFHRYLAIVQQATHDYSYGYKTPPELMPVTIDLFTGYIAYLHEMEERFLYPVARSHMNPEQQANLRLVIADQHEEMDTAKAWLHDAAQYEKGQKKLAVVVESIDYLARMLNRHIVLEEERVLPVLDALTPKEQGAFLNNVRTFERQIMGQQRWARYERLLGYIEQRVHAIAGRIW